MQQLEIRFDGRARSRLERRLQPGLAAPRRRRHEIPKTFKHSCASQKRWLSAEGAAAETATGFKKEIRLAGPIHHRARSVLGAARPRGSEARLKAEALLQWKPTGYGRESRICTPPSHFKIRGALCSFGRLLADCTLFSTSGHRATLHFARRHTLPLVSQPCSFG